MIVLRSVVLLVAAFLVGCGGSDRVDRRAGGGLCGIPGLEGEPRETFQRGGCGITDPVAVTRVAGVTLSRPALMNCRTAGRLDAWVRGGAIPAVGDQGGGLASMTVAAHYACRTRNHQPGAKLSEHAKGNAIDLSNFTLADGSTISVLADWRGSGRKSRVLRRMHGAACGPFGTVLGPNADRFHQDHFHFDTAAHRGGAYCR
jgi:hypothetical protein